MSYFVKRPEVFEGRQWNGTYEDALDIANWSNFGVDLTGSGIKFSFTNLLISTIKPFSWLVKDSLGDLCGVYDSAEFNRLFVEVDQVDDDDDICACGNTFCMEDHGLIDGADLGDTSNLPEVRP